MKKKLNLSVLFCGLFILSAMAQTKDIQSVVASVKEKYAPDTRVEVFDIKTAQRGDSLVLKGKTSSEAAYRELLSAAKTLSAEVKDSILLLPNPKLGEKTWGVVYNSAAYIREEGNYSAEIVTQALLGMPVRILEQHAGWRRVQTPDKYIGWVYGSVKPMTKKELQAYLAKPKIVIASFYATSLEKPSSAAQPVSDLVAGDMLPLKKVSGGYFQVEYPDGREAYVAKRDAAKEKDWQRGIHLTEESILSTAYRFKGVPYFWGGTSTKGIDCSGLTKMVYFLNGIILARDASQQARYGIDVDSEGKFEGLQKGDLMFFGTKPDAKNPKGRVVHVGIYIGDKRFIHASDYIRISSFNPADADYDEHNTKRYLRSKRIIGAVNTEGIDAIWKNEFYQ
ncbi:MAG: C40 family peptidase [Dysgonamonadaceae bacterium]|jgi:cell wall-associated NlpC family hydrolase|nr:C40 family peptidase [Dysgonamonadaceae bacterium]